MPTRFFFSRDDAMKRISILSIFLTALPLLLTALPAQAEKADADQPTNVEANQMAYDSAKQINTFTGNVVLTRGSLTMRADRMIVSQDAAGYQYATVYAAARGLATFRQKRDGGPNFWIEGQAADRIEFDTKSEVAKFYSKARIRLLEGQRITDEVEGEFISYDSKAEFYTVNNNASGQSKPGSGRIRAVIQPRSAAGGK
jgi:lipopolysaccharide export system protein LptA